MNRGVFPGGSPVDPHLSSPFQGEERQRHVRSVLPPERGELEGGLRTRRPLLIEGYASLFGVPDASGDVVRAGAFARSLQRGAQLPMLLQHRPGAMAGRWVRMIEDGRGLYVRGLVEGVAARSMVAQGLSGLSIGFRPRLWNARRPDGRELVEVDLVEVSLVTSPMQARARFALLGAEAKAA
ncbi:MAG: HK97 family phage prohead protease [Hyphomonadaceae bacterium]|nr:HK97 family phage prohead protease [Hyphomonadaceae bacterium]MBA29076.1 HK97 family phage prohead protease [Hyphomonadaceae bacterium]